MVRVQALLPTASATVLYDIGALVPTFRDLIQKFKNVQSSTNYLNSGFIPMVSLSIKLTCNHPLNAYRSNVSDTRGG